MGIVLGNNDGMLMGVSGIGCDINGAFSGEIGKFWNDLSLAGLKANNTARIYSDGSAGIPNAKAADLVNGYIPKIPLGQDVGIIACGESANHNYYTISNFHMEGTSIVPTATPSLALKPAEALAIDSKIDDGTFSGGEIIGADTPYGYYGLAPQSLGADPTHCENPTGKYNASLSTPACTIQVRIGLQNGEMK